MTDHTTKGPPHSLGIRHLALRVIDIKKSKAFYQRVFGMRLVWEPDTSSSYLSSGSDNLALHQIEGRPSISPQAHAHSLDHFGFLMENPEAVDAMRRWVEACEIPITSPPKRHRDGSYSFYLADPDGHIIQILYEPNADSRTAGTDR